MQKLTLQIVYSYVLRFFLKIIVGVKFENTEFLKEETQFIIVANHNSHLDTMTLLASLPKNIIHKVKPVAAADHFGKTKLKEKLTNFFVNTLLIQRKRDFENPINDPINKMIKALESGYSLIIFPEGTRGEPEIAQPLKPGVAYVLKIMPHIKYIPAFMKGMGKAMPKDDNLIIPHNASITFGKPKLVNATEKDQILMQIEKDIYALKDL